MPYPLLLALGAVAGFRARPALVSRFPLLFRSQQVAIAAPMALVAGWALEFSAEFTATLATVALAEWVTLGLVRRRPALLASAAHANAGFWAMPVTSSLLPSALPLAVVNGMFGLVRGAPILVMFRRSSAVPQSRQTGLMDFSPSLLLLVGMGMGRFWPPPAWSPGALSTFADFLGVYGMFLIAAALPDRLPSRSAWLQGAAALPVRFVAPLTVTALVWQTGLPLSALVWILALAPVPLNTLVQARVFGLDHEVATTQLVVTAGAAVLALPAVVLLIRGAGGP